MRCVKGRRRSPLHWGERLLSGRVERGRLSVGLFVPPGAAFVVGGDEAFDRTVVGQFHIFREEAGRQLAFGAVMGNALAAVSVADTPRGAARTLRVSGTLLTFHRLIFWWLLVGFRMHWGRFVAFGEPCYAAEPLLNLRALPQVGTRGREADWRGVRSRGAEAGDTGCDRLRQHGRRQGGRAPEPIRCGGWVGRPFDKDRKWHRFCRIRRVFQHLFCR